jgi:mono/diheme cytochrome c family protein
MHQKYPVLLVSGAVLAAVLAACAGEPEDRGPATATATPAAEVGAVIDQGAELYQANCQSCHGDEEGRGASGGAPPHNSSGHTWHHPDAQLTEWILRGKPPGAMPAFGGRLTEAEVDAILAFIKTWWTPEQRETQEDVSKRYEEALERQRRQ